MGDAGANPFEEWLNGAQGAGPRNFRAAVIDVADTAYVCKLWFESYGLNATVADIMAMARLVMEREAALEKAEKELLYEREDDD